MKPGGNSLMNTLESKYLNNSLPLMSRGANSQSVRNLTLDLGSDSMLSRGGLRYNSNNRYNSALGNFSVKSSSLKLPSISRTVDNTNTITSNGGNSGLSPTPSTMKSNRLNRSSL